MNVSIRPARRLFVLLVTVALSFSAPAFGAPPSQDSLVGSWLITIEGEAATRSLIISEEAPTSDGALLMAKYGMSNQGVSPVEAKMVKGAEQRQIILTTQAGSKIVATEQANGSFQGTFTLKNGGSKGVVFAKTTEDALKQLVATKAPTTPAQAISIVQVPGADVPANCAAFSGGFGGEWPNFGRLNLWVVRIGSDCNAQVWYGAAPQPSAQSKFLSATIKGDILSMPRPDGGTTTFERNGDTLKGEYRGPSGVNSATMQRINVGSAAQAQADADQRAALAVIAPSADVPAECAAYHGNWVGNWSQGGFTEQYLRVVEVRNSGDGCLVRYSYSGSKSPIPAKETTALRNGTISFVCNRSTGGTCVFQRNGDVISASYTNPGGGSNNGTFKKVQ